jgi:hypothetical protein
MPDLQLCRFPAATRVILGAVRMGRHQNVIYGTVRDSRGNPVPQARVYFTAAPVSLPDIAALTDTGGAFSLAVPSEGTYQIESAADGFTPTSVTVDVTPDQGTKLEIVLKN